MSYDTPPEDSSFLRTMRNIAPSAFDAFGNLGTVFGKQAQGDENSAAQQGLLNNNANSNLINLYRSQQDAQNQAAQTDLARKNYEIGSRNTNAKTALVAALLNGGFAPTSISGGHPSGGLAAKLRTDPDAMASMRNLQGQADQAQMAPMDWSKTYQYQGGDVVAPPTLLQVPDLAKAGGGKAKTGGILQTLGTLGSLAVKFL